MSTRPVSHAPAAAADAPPAASALGGLLACMSLCMLLSSLGTSIANVALPTLADVFQASFSEVQWVIVAYLVTHTVAVFFAGRLGDFAGRRRVLMGGIAVFVAASAVCATAGSLPLLIAARAMQGAGAAALVALSMALVGDALPKKATGRAMGLLGTTSAVGTALGPSLGGLLLAGIGWEAVFLINVPLGLVALLLSWRFLPSHRHEVRAGARGMAEVLRNGTVFSGLALSFIVATVMMTTLVVAPFYLSGAMSLSAVAVGFVMSAGPIVSAVVGVPAGRWVDRHGTRRMILLGLGGMFTGCAGLSIAPAGWGVAGYVLPLVVLTAHYALFQAANNTAVMANASAETRGGVSGAVGLARNAGLILGASAMGWVFAAASGATDVATAPPVDVAVGMRAVFAVAAALTAMALAIAWARDRHAH